MPMASPAIFIKAYPLRLVRFLNAIFKKLCNMLQFLNESFTAKQMPYSYDCTNQLFILFCRGDCTKMMQWNVRFYNPYLLAAEYNKNYIYPLAGFYVQPNEKRSTDT